MFKKNRVQNFPALPSLCQRRLTYFLQTVILLLVLIASEALLQIQKQNLITCLDKRLRPSPFPVLIIYQTCYFLGQVGGTIPDFVRLLIK